MKTVLALSAFAFGWHIGDAALILTRAPRKARLFWVGVGVGWSLWMFQTHFRAPQMTATKPRNMLRAAIDGDDPIAYLNAQGRRK